MVALNTVRTFGVNQISGYIHRFVKSDKKNRKRPIYSIRAQHVSELPSYIRSYIRSQFNLFYVRKSIHPTSVVDPGGDDPVSDPTKEELRTSAILDSDCIT